MFVCQCVGCVVGQRLKYDANFRTSCYTRISTVGNAERYEFSNQYVPTLPGPSSLAGPRGMITLLNGAVCVSDEKREVQTRKERFPRRTEHRTLDTKRQGGGLVHSHNPTESWRRKWFYVWLLPHRAVRKVIRLVTSIFLIAPSPCSSQPPPPCLRPTTKG